MRWKYVQRRLISLMSFEERLHKLDLYLLKFRLRRNLNETCKILKGFEKVGWKRMLAPQWENPELGSLF